MRWLRPGVGLWLLLGALLLRAGPLAAQAELPHLEARAAWNGYERETWTELLITLQQGSVAWRGELLISNEREALTYRLPVDLPAQSRKLYRLPVFTGSEVRLKLTLRSAQGGAEGISTLFLTPLDDQARLCGAIGTQVTAFPAACTKSFLFSDLSALPESGLAWDTLDVLFLDGVSTQGLSEEQRQALADWVALGGQLIVGGGDGLRPTLEGLPAVLRDAAQPVQVRVQPSFPLADAPARTWLVSPLQGAVSAEPLLLQDGEVLALRQPVGVGEIVIVGAELSPLMRTAWLQQLVALRRVPAVSFPFRSTPLSRVVDEDKFPSVWTLFQFPRRALPGGVTSFFFLLPLLYIGLTVLLPFLVARSTRRPLVAWLLLPGIIGGASLGVGAFLFLGLSGVFPISHTISLGLVPDPRAQARIFHYTGFYLPRQNAVTWETADWPRPMNGTYATQYYFDEGEPFPAEVVYAFPQNQVHLRNSKGVATWMTEALRPAPELRVTLTVAGEEGALTLRGSLWSAQPLQETFLIWGQGAVYTLTTALPEAVTQPLALKLDEILTLDAMPAVLQAFLAGDSDQGNWGCLVFTRAAGGAPPYAAMGRLAAQDFFWVYKVPCPALETAAPITLSPSFWHFVPEESYAGLGMPYNSGFIGFDPYGGMSYYTYRPVSLPLSEIHSLTIKLTLESGNLPGTLFRRVEAFDWQDGAWQSLPETLLTKGEVMLTGAEAARWLKPGTMDIKCRLQLRDNLTSMAYDALKFEFTLRGKP